jgi:hypothetical protein
VPTVVVAAVATATPPALPAPLPGGKPVVV